MKLNKEHSILIVGLGLLGGCYAMALSRQGFHVNAISPEQKDLDFALTRGWIEKGFTQVNEESVSGADLVIFALYPHVFLSWIREHQALLKENAILTDVTGVKGCIVNEIQSILREDLEFIPAHPMAGREVSGVQNSDDAIFRGANYVVTPTEQNTPSAIELCEDLGRTLGFARISRLSPEEHDTVIAFVSQLTHCIAVSLMTCQQMEHLEDYTGDSFRDLTRIARLNDAMWSELFLANKASLLEQMDLFERELRKMRGMLERDDREALREMMRFSTQRRALFDKKKD